MLQRSSTTSQFVQITSRPLVSLPRCKIDTEVLDKNKSVNANVLVHVQNKRKGKVAVSSTRTTSLSRSLTNFDFLARCLPNGSDIDLRWAINLVE
ncbi:hypothetical protein PTI98_005493 [Pleurotus ostreatus]|nr:hypothetical protein PTI98_005493 [Pleurotus ostreatus]